MMACVVATAESGQNNEKWELRRGADVGDIHWWLGVDLPVDEIGASSLGRTQVSPALLPWHVHNHIGVRHCCGWVWPCRSERATCFWGCIRALRNADDICADV